MVKNNEMPHLGCRSETNQNIAQFNCPLCNKLLMCRVTPVHLHWRTTVDHRTREIYGPDSTKVCTYGDCRYKFKCSHDSFIHVTAHFRLVTIRAPDWIHVDAIEPKHLWINGGVDPVTIPTVSEPMCADLVTPASSSSYSAADISNFQLPSHSSSDTVVNVPASGLLKSFCNVNMSELTPAQAENIFILLYNPSNKRYKQHSSFIRKINSQHKTDKEMLPLKALRAKLRKLFKESLDFNTLKFKGKSETVVKIKYMNLSQILHMWICDGTIFKMLRWSYLKNTEPFLANIDNEPTPTQTFSGSESGSEWLSVLKRTSETWTPMIAGLDTKEDVIFLHLGMCHDTFAKYNRPNDLHVDDDDDGHVLMVTLLELGPTVRNKFKFDATVPLLFVDKAVGDAEGVQERMMPIYANQLRDLAKGVEMYCGPLGKTIKVFAFVSCIIGDKPAGILNLNENEEVRFPGQTSASSTVDLFDNSMYSAVKSHLRNLIEYISGPVSDGRFESGNVYENLYVEYKRLYYRNPRSGLKEAMFFSEKDLSKFPDDTIQRVIRFIPFCLKGLFRYWFSKTTHYKAVKEALELFREHVECFSMISSATITAGELDNLSRKITDIHARANEFFGQYEGSEVINTGTAVNHVDLVKRFGPYPCFSNAPFQHHIKRIRRYCREKCLRRRLPSQLRFLKKFYARTLASYRLGEEDYKKNNSRRRFKESSEEVYRGGSKKDTLFEVIKKDGLSIKEECYYLVSVEGVEQVVKVSRMHLRSGERFKIRCKFSFEPAVQESDTMKAEYKLKNRKHVYDTVSSDQFIKQVFILPTKRSDPCHRIAYY